MEDKLISFTTPDFYKHFQEVYKDESKVIAHYPRMRTDSGISEDLFTVEEFLENGVRNTYLIKRISRNENKLKEIYPHWFKENA